MTSRHPARIAIFLSAILLLALSTFVARGQDENMWCGAAWACEAATAPAAGNTQRVVVQYLALALAGKSLRVGASYGEASAQAAAQTALSNCARNTGTGVANTDCKIVQSGSNTCLAIAVSHPENVYAYSGASPTRLAAWNSAMATCRSAGGKSCIVQTTPCAGDDARYPPRFPLPPDSNGATVDPVLVGTWEVPVNPGRWVWELGPHGTYEFHSEAPDGAPSHAGRFTASGGKWTLLSTTAFNDSDGGTYQMQGADVMVATGKLGTGNWHRIK